MTRREATTTLSLDVTDGRRPGHGSGVSSETKSLLDPAERQVILDAPRPRRALPLLGALVSRSRHLPLLGASREVDRRHRPVHAVWELTLRCDLACRHCGSRAGRARPDELDLAEAIDLVAQMAELGVQEVTLIGGEVYLFPGWTDVVRAVVGHGMSCAIVSGGQGIDAEVARAAERAGVGSLSISIDGEETTHDRLRGKAGAHEKALEALRHASLAGIAIAVNSQINRLNVHELDAIADVVLGRGCHGWQLQLTVPAGRAADEPDVLLQPEDLLELFPILSRLHTRLTERGVKFLPGNNIGYFGPYERQFREALRCPTDASVQCRSLRARHRGQWRREGLPFAADARVGRRQRERSSPRRHLGARRRAQVYAGASPRTALGLLSDVLLQRQLPSRLHLDVDGAVRSSR